MTRAKRVAVLLAILYVAGSVTTAPTFTLDATSHRAACLRMAPLEFVVPTARFCRVVTCLSDGSTSGPICEAQLEVQS